MGRKAKPWPSYALWALEDVTAILLDIQTGATKAQRAIRDGKQLEAVIQLADIRDAANRALRKLEQARHSDYQEAI